MAYLLYEEMMSVRLYDLCILFFLESPLSISISLIAKRGFVVEIERNLFLTNSMKMTFINNCFYEIYPETN